MTALLVVLSLTLSDVRAGCEPTSGALAVTFGSTTVVASRDGFFSRSGATIQACEENDAGPIATGETVAGIPYRLTVGGAWSLSVGAAQTTLAPPAQLRNAAGLRILGGGPSRVWLAGVGVLGMVEIGTGRIEAARLHPRRVQPLAIAVGHSAEIAVGRDLFNCDTPSSCETLANLAGPVTAVVANDLGVLLAVGGADGGLFRAQPGRLDEVVRLAAGTVDVLCEEQETGDAWALLRQGEGVRVAAISMRTSALELLSPNEVLVRGVTDPAEPDLEATDRVLALAAEQEWPELERLALRLRNDARPIVRRSSASALAGLRSASAFAALWLLGHDADPDVRLDALYASIRRCQEDASLTCTQVLGHFLADTATDVAWTARDAMLEENPRAALQKAPSAYKLDAVAGLVARLQRDGAVSARRALELLAADHDPKVRDAARMALVGNLP